MKKDFYSFVLLAIFSCLHTVNATDFSPSQIPPEENGDIVFFRSSPAPEKDLAADTTLVKVLPSGGTKHLKAPGSEALFGRGHNIQRLNTPDTDAQKPSHVSVDFHNFDQKEEKKQKRKKKKYKKAPKKKKRRNAKRSHKEEPDETTNWQWQDCQAYDMFCISCCVKAGCCHWKKVLKDIKTPTLPLCTTKEGNCLKSYWQCFSSSIHRTAQFFCSPCCCMSKGFPCCCGPCSKGKSICYTWRECALKRKGKFWGVMYFCADCGTAQWAESCCPS